MSSWLKGLFSSSQRHEDEKAAQRNQYSDDEDDTANIPEDSRPPRLMHNKQRADLCIEEEGDADEEREEIDIKTTGAVVSHDDPAVVEEATPAPAKKGKKRKRAKLGPDEDLELPKDNLRPVESRIEVLINVREDAETGEGADDGVKAKKQKRDTKKRRKKTTTAPEAHAEEEEDDGLLALPPPAETAQEESPVAQPLENPEPAEQIVETNAAAKSKRNPRKPRKGTRKQAAPAEQPVDVMSTEPKGKSGPREAETPESTHEAGDDIARLLNAAISPANNETADSTTRDEVAEDTNAVEAEQPRAKKPSKKALGKRKAADDLAQSQPKKRDRSKKSDASNRKISDIFPPADSTQQAAVSQSKPRMSSPISPSFTAINQPTRKQPSPLPTPVSKVTNGNVEKELHQVTNGNTENELHNDTEEDLHDEVEVEVQATRSPKTPSPVEAKKPKAKKPQKKHQKKPREVPTRASSDERPIVPRTGPKLSAPLCEDIANAIYNYRSMEGLTQRELNTKIHEPFNDNRQLWTWLYDATPHIPKTHVLHACRRTYHNFEGRGRWTEEQDADLRFAHEQFNGSWKQIGHALNRFPEDARDRWRNYVSCGQTMRKNGWDVNEEKKLSDVIHNYIKSIREAEEKLAQRERGNDNDSDYEHRVDWGVVSKNMGHTRSRLQCAAKWKLMKARATKIVEKGEGRRESARRSFRSDRRIAYAMSPAEKLDLLYKIQNHSVESEDIIDWRLISFSILQEMGLRISMHALRFCYETLRDAVPDHADLELQAVVSHLISAFEKASPHEPAGLQFPGYETSEEGDGELMSKRYIDDSDGDSEGQATGATRDGSTRSARPTLSLRQALEQPKKHKPGRKPGKKHNKGEDTQDGIEAGDEVDVGDGESLRRSERAHARKSRFRDGMQRQSTPRETPRPDALETGDDEIDFGLLHSSSKKKSTGEEKGYDNDGQVTSVRRKKRTRRLQNRTDHITNGDEDEVDEVDEAREVPQVWELPPRATELQPSKERSVDEVAESDSEDGVPQVEGESKSVSASERISSYSSPEVKEEVMERARSSMESSSRWMSTSQDVDAAADSVEGDGAGSEVEASPDHAEEWHIKAEGESDEEEIVLGDGWPQERSITETSREDAELGGMDVDGESAAEQGITTKSKSTTESRRTRDSTTSDPVMHSDTPDGNPYENGSMAEQDWAHDADATLKHSYHDAPSPILGGSDGGSPAGAGGGIVVMADATTEPTGKKRTGRKKKRVRAPSPPPVISSDDEMSDIPARLYPVRYDDSA